jgi:hypothetical protein
MFPRQRALRTDLKENTTPLLPHCWAADIVMDESWAVSEQETVAGKGQQQYDWTEAVHVTNTDDRPGLSSEGAPDIDKTVNVKQKLISGHEPQMGLDTKTDWPTDCRS